MVSRLQPGKVTVWGGQRWWFIWYLLLSWLVLRNVRNVQSSKFSKKSAGKIIVFFFFFSPKFKKNPLKVFCNPLFREDCQELTIINFSSPRLTLAPVAQIPSLPNSSRNLLPHVLPSSLESLVSASFHFYFLLPSHFTKSLLCCPLQLPSSFSHFHCWAF